MNDEFHLTPIDVRAQEFRRATLGYERARVEDFRERVAEEMERLLRERATRVVATAGRRIEWTGNLTGRGRTLSSPTAYLRPGIHEEFRVGVCGVLEQFLLRRRFDELSEIHDGNAVADVFDHREVGGLT